MTEYETNKLLKKLEKILRNDERFKSEYNFKHNIKKLNNSYTSIDMTSLIIPFLKNNTINHNMVPVDNNINEQLETLNKLIENTNKKLLAFKMEYVG